MNHISFGLMVEVTNECSEMKWGKASDIGVVNSLGAFSILPNILLWNSLLRIFEVWHDFLT